jgi:hypothetical protein
MPNDSPSTVRYPGFDVLAKWESPDWDEPTRAVVRRRLAEVPDVRFFTDAEARTLAAVADRIVPQPERTSAGKVPIVPWIDDKLFHDRRDGYRYEEMPPQREAWRRGLAAIDETARARSGRAFADLDASSQDAVLQEIQRGSPPGAAWETLPARRFVRDVLCVTIVKVYFAHPLAWNEVGYNGPSSPRGHVRKWEGGVDPWEAREK